MSRENVEVVRRIIDAINRGDLDAAMETISRGIELDLSNSRGPMGGIYRGRDDARRLFESFLGAWAALAWDPKELIGLDAERVLSVSQFRVRGRGSGAETSASGAMIWTIRDGETAAVALYQSKAAALEAVGLRAK